jgi:2-hydroxychromene-2-carboxylate isomerase
MNERPQPQAIDFYFDFISPFGYFASLRIDALGAAHGRVVEWHSMRQCLGTAAVHTSSTRATPGSTFIACNSRGETL